MNRTDKLGEKLQKYIDIREDAAKACGKESALAVVQTVLDLDPAVELKGDQWRYPSVPQPLNPAWLCMQLYCHALHKLQPVCPKN